MVALSPKLAPFFPNFCCHLGDLTWSDPPRPLHKWGPPGKIEKLDGKTIYYYYFQKGKASGLAIGSSSVTGLSGDYTEGVLVYQFTGDESGKVIKQRKYWKQPDTNEGYGAGWKLLDSNEEALVYYDAQSITRPSKNIVRVGIRHNYTEKGVLNYVENLGKKYENLSHLIILQEINCAEKKSRLLTANGYDHKGSVIDSGRSPSEWKFIIPETMNESLYKEVCK